MFLKLRTDLTRKLKLIKLLIINAEIFLTEGRNPYSQSPDFGKGHELRALKKLGVQSVAFSTSESETLYTILGQLGIGLLNRNISQKSILYSRLKIEYSVSDHEIAFIGWDLSDLPIIEMVNFSVAPANAPLEIKAKSYYVSYGIGEEAVREVAELIFRAKSP